MKKNRLSDDRIEYRVVEPVADDAPEDKTTVQINRQQAAYDEILLDEQGFPTLTGLEAWHRKNNPHLFAGEA